MSGLGHSRCLNHPSREAAARCPECRQFFCRECITEHEDRLLCAACLRKLTRATGSRRVRWLGWVRLAQALAGLWLGWFCFYSAGRILLTLPDSFHEGTIWQGGGGEDE